MFQKLHLNYQNRQSEIEEPYFSEPIEVVDGTAVIDGKAVTVPSKFVIPDKLQPQGTYQEWGGFVPPCTLDNQDDCKYVPVQTANIKVGTIYNAIEKESDFWMDLACGTAHDSIAEKGGPFGAVILQVDSSDGSIIRFWKNHNQVTSIMDPTAHAEVMTIRSACKSLGVFNLGDIQTKDTLLTNSGNKSFCVIYSSAEPCPMCYSAICWANIPTLLFGATRFDAAVQGVNFSDEEIYDELATAYSKRKMNVFQCSSGVSLDAFNTWKRTEKTNY